MTTTNPITSAPDGRAAERAAWIFYTIAAAGSSIGQIWVGVTIPPWPATMPWWARALLVLPFAVVVDLGGVVTAAFADARRRLGETALGWQVLSTASATGAVGINIVGHHDIPYLAVVFGGLGTFAYTVWLMHSAARRRDALRAAGKLAPTAPAYGIGQWWREPAVTRRARDLALQHRYTVHESLTEARRRLREERRTAALAAQVETLIRSRHKDPTIATIAVTTLDIQAVATTLAAQSDIAGWARAIAVDLAPPPVEKPEPAVLPEDTDVVPVEVPKDLLRRVPVQQADYQRWRDIWQQMLKTPDDTNSVLAAEHGIAVRQIQHIRAAGAAGLLDSPMPPVQRLLHLLQQPNGHHPTLPAAP
ncbi:hypothetical protein [Rugosimonospora africana]|uniref:DUF2637 domain-containing protein n=1 Tax=Rugosimonospora africana TaxID=556532 RepID=A0A8J3VRH1_9ACTN|nr:hypothetical protein [Rugosimonospora africana]GIH16119.1 hypothetical protein Raf01_42910 [Rugosimonospora africana]